jgi:hypothetical protein
MPRCAKPRGDGWDVRLTAFVGAYQWKAPLNGDGTGGGTIFASPSPPSRLRMTRRAHWTTASSAPCG